MISEYLIQLADKLDANGKIDAADAVDKVIRTGSLQKVAQYVGVIGYILKQNRAMANCIRMKRVSAKGSMQEVVLSCLKEYQDGQDYNDTEWSSKYAQVVQSKPELFDLAHIAILAKIAEENDIPTHVKNLIELDSVLEKNACQDNLVRNILNDFQTLGDVIKKEIGADNPFPFKVAAPPSPRSWWSRLWHPTDSLWRDTTRGRKDDARVEMDNILQNLMEITSLAQQIRLHISQLKHQILSTSSPITPEVRQLIYDINPDDTWWDMNKQLMAIEQRMGELPFESANFIRNIHNKINGVYQRLHTIQGLMMNLRQRDAVLGWEDDPNAPPTEEFEALNDVMNHLYTDPLNEEYLYYARRMHSRLDQRLKGKTVPTGIREMYITLRNRGMSHDSIVEQIAAQMGNTPEEVDKLLNENLRTFPTGRSFGFEPVNTKKKQQTDELGGISVSTPAQEEQLTKQEQQRVDDVINFIVGDELIREGTPAEKAAIIRRMLHDISQLMPKNKIWQAIDKKLEQISERIVSPTTQNIGEAPAIDDESQIPNEPVSETEDVNTLAVLDWAQKSPLAKAQNARIGDVSELKQWLEQLSPNNLDRFIDEADTFTEGIGEAEKVVASLLDPIVYKSKRQGYAKPYDRINDIILKAVHKVVPSTTSLSPNELRKYFRTLNHKQMDQIEQEAIIQGAQAGIDDIEQYIDKLRQYDSGFESFEEGVNYDDFKREPMEKQQSVLDVLIRIADKVDTIDRTIADKIDEYIAEHINDEWPEFPEFSKLVREK